MDSLKDGEFCHLLAIPSRDRLERVLKYMLDEKEFLSDYGIRSMSKVHQTDPFMMNVRRTRCFKQFKLCFFVLSSCNFSVSSLHVGHMLTCLL